VIVVGVLGVSGAAVMEIARRAAATGVRTEVVGVAPSGARGDRHLLALTTAGVGHATVTRAGLAPGSGSAAAELGIEPADLDLALRYLPDIRVVVLSRPAAPLLATALAAAAFAGAALVIVGPLDAAALDAASLETPGNSSPIVLEPPARDPDGAFAGLVAALAVRLDANEEPASAWASTLSSLTIDQVSRAGA
jgi:hypothetical protein